jgi:hypothetical protein
MAILRKVRYEADGLYAQVNTNQWFVAPPGVEIPPSILREANQETHPSTSCDCIKCNQRRRSRQETPSYLRGEVIEDLPPSYKSLVFREPVGDARTLLQFRQTMDAICSVKVIEPGEADRERAIQRRRVEFDEILSSTRERALEYQRQLNMSRQEHIRHISGMMYGRPVRVPTLVSPPDEEKPKVEKVVKGRRIKTRPSED